MTGVRESTTITEIVIARLVSFRPKRSPAAAKGSCCQNVAISARGYLFHPSFLQEGGFGLFFWAKGGRYFCPFHSVKEEIHHIPI